MKVLAIDITYQMSQFRTKAPGDSLLTMKRKCQKCQKLTFHTGQDSKSEPCRCFDVSKQIIENNFIQRRKTETRLDSLPESQERQQENYLASQQDKQKNDSFQLNQEEMNRNRILNRIICESSKINPANEGERKPYFFSGGISSENSKHIQKRLSKTNQKNLKVHFSTNKFNEKIIQELNPQKYLRKIEQYPSNEHEDWDQQKQGTIELESQNIPQIIPTRRSHFSVNGQRNRQSSCVSDLKSYLNQFKIKDENYDEKSQEKTTNPQNKLDLHWKKYREGISKREEDERKFQQRVQMESLKQIEKQRELMKMRRKEREEESQNQYKRIMELSKQNYKNLKALMARKRRRQHQYYIEVSQFKESTSRIIIFVQGLEQNETLLTITQQLRQIQEISERIRHIYEIYDRQRVENNIFERLKQLRTAIVYKISIQLIRGFHNRIVNEFRQIIDEPINNGFTKEEIENNFVQFTFDEELQCSICLEIVNKEIKVRKLQCEHKFHSNCIEVWLQNSKSCPICRKKQTLTNNK